MTMKHVGMAALGGLAALQMNVLPAKATTEGERDDQIRCSVQTFEKDLFRYRLFDCAGFTGDDSEMPNGIVDHVLIGSVTDEEDAPPLVTLYNTEDGGSVDTARRVKIPRIGYGPLKKYLTDVFQNMFVNLGLLQKEENTLFNLNP